MVLPPLIGLAAALFVLRAVDYQRVQADLDAAATTFEAARQVGTREYAPDNWQVATSRMDTAMAELHRQQGRFVLFRSYPRVHALLTKAIDAAEVAKATAEGARKAAEEEKRRQTGRGSGELWSVGGAVPTKEEARAAITAAKASLDRTMGVFARIQRCPRAMRAREVRKDLATAGGNLDAYRQRVPELLSRYTNEDFTTAKAQADTLKGLLDALNKDLEGVLLRFKCE